MLNQIGSNVLRSYTFSFPLSQEGTIKHVIICNGYGTSNCSFILNDDLFSDFDEAIDLANRYGMKVIIPLIDNWDWWGGIKAFSKMFGKEKEDFFNDQQLRNEFNYIGAFQDELYHWHAALE